MENIAIKGLSSTYSLNNNYAIPCMGLGTWKMEESDETIKAVRYAIEHGYRLIDTASIYNNEVSVGKAIKESSIDRSELFVTSKVWNNARGYDKTKEAFKKTLDEMKLDYLDLYLIHWPASEHSTPEWREINAGTWRAMEELYKEGLIKAIGVSNFLPHHLSSLIDSAEITPMVNQLEFHPGFEQKEAVTSCKKHHIIVESWGPLAQGKLIGNSILEEMGKKYGKTAAQLCIRWTIQKGIIPLPKSIDCDRIASNAKVFDFNITDSDMAAIDGINNAGYSGLDPDKIDF